MEIRALMLIPSRDARVTGIAAVAYWHPAKNAPRKSK
jgi:hypothetical protein